MKKTGSFILILVLVACFVLPVAAGAGIPAVTDRAALLSESEETALVSAVKAASGSLGCPVALVTYSNPDPDRNYIGEDFLRDNGLTLEDDLLLLIVKQENSTYYYDLYHYGVAETLITKGEVDVILDTPDVYDNLKSGRIAEGLRAFLRVAVEEGADNDRRLNPYLATLTWAFPVSLVIALGACVGVKIRYTMKLKSVDYPLDRYARLELTDHYDLFVGKTVTRRTIQSSSGGSSGGSRGGGSGHAGGR